MSSASIKIKKIYKFHKFLIKYHSKIKFKMQLIKIEKVSALEILNSNGMPTLEVKAVLSDGTSAVVGVPSGTSRGMKEMHELIDEDSQRFGGKGALRAVRNVNEQINDLLFGQDPFAQKLIDQRLITLDDTANKSNLGANAMLGTSLAVAMAAAKSLKVDFFRYLGGIGCDCTLSTPMINVINGGAHSNNSLAIQEFMLVPQKNGNEGVSDLIHKSARVISKLKQILHDRNFSTNVGLEGGFAPDLQNTEEVLDLLCLAVEKSGYKLVDDFMFALDAAANDFFLPDNNNYIIDNKSLKTTEMIDFYDNLVNKYPIFSIEDALMEDDWNGWFDLTQKMRDKILLVGDDLFATNINLLKKLSEKEIANAILIKTNQIGTLSETMEVLNHANEINYQTIVSHRSGETNDTFLIHLAIAFRSKFVKIGSLARGERIAKYNELLRLEKKFC